MKPPYIKDFEKLGFGIFVHFGLFSLLGKGEWFYKNGRSKEVKSYFTDEFANKFNPKKDWAIKIVKKAKKIGAKYITLTTKHHEGYCLYDSKGLTNWDCMNLGPKRDLVKEFVDACNQEGIVPFFYHALLDWHHEDYQNNFPKYIDYLNNSIEILCKNYGKIGGFWFDGFWDKPNENWQFDRLYELIRKYQPTAMIINNTGLSATGEVSHYEIDSVTFERGKPFVVSSSDGKERAGEMCEVFGEHWGYAKDDINFKPISEIINSLLECRYCNCNFLLNVGPKGDGSLRDLDKCYLDAIGYWIRRNKNFIYNVKRANLEMENAYVLQDDKYFYAIIKNVPMSSDVNVQLGHEMPTIKLKEYKIMNATYLDIGERVTLNEDKSSFKLNPFFYGSALSTRVVRFKIKK